MKETKIIIKADDDNTQFEVQGEAQKLGAISSCIVSGLLGFFDKNIEDKDVAEAIQYAILSSAMEAANIDIDDFYDVCRHTKKIDIEPNKKKKDKKDRKDETHNEEEIEKNLEELRDLLKDLLQK